MLGQGTMSGEALEALRTSACGKEEWVPDVREVLVALRYSCGRVLGLQLGS